MRRRDLIIAGTAALGAASLPAAAASPNQIEALFWEWWALVRNNEPDACWETLSTRIAEINGEIGELRAVTARDLAMQIVVAYDDGANELSQEFAEKHIRSIIGLPDKRAWEL